MVQMGFKLWTFGQIIELLKEALEGPFIWTPDSEPMFCNIKMALISAAALGLPDLTKPFELSGHKWQHLILGVLA